MTVNGDNPIMNNVHIEKRRKRMNTVVTSREAILEAGRTLLREKGWSAVNIRSVAAQCGVSVGSIYNYFSSKTELVSATVESIWCDIFHFSEQENNFDSFGDCIRWVFCSLKEGEERYPGFFTFHSVGFVDEDKKGGKQLMAQSWEHIRTGLCMVLKKDRKIRPDAFDGNFTPEMLSEIVFSLILSEMLQKRYSGIPILEMIRRLIY